MGSVAAEYLLSDSCLRSSTPPRQTPLDEVSRGFSRRTQGPRLTAGTCPSQAATSWLLRALPIRYGFSCHGCRLDGDCKLRVEELKRNASSQTSKPLDGHALRLRASAEAPKLDRPFPTGRRMLSKRRSLRRATALCEQCHRGDGIVDASNRHDPRIRVEVASFGAGQVFSSSEAKQSPIRQVLVPLADREDLIAACNGRGCEGLLCDWRSQPVMLHHAASTNLQRL